MHDLTILPVLRRPKQQSEEEEEEEEEAEAEAEADGLPPEAVRYQRAHHVTHR